MGKYITKICCVSFSCKMWIFSNRLSHAQKLGNRAQESVGNCCLSPLCSYQASSSDEYLTLCLLVFRFSKEPERGFGWLRSELTLLEPRLRQPGLIKTIWYRYYSFFFGGGGVGSSFLLLLESFCAEKEMTLFLMQMCIQAIVEAK